jgi:hypothetical protein
MNFLMMVLLFLRSVFISILRHKEKLVKIDRNAHIKLIQQEQDFQERVEKWKSNADIVRVRQESKKNKQAQKDIKAAARQARRAERNQERKNRAEQKVEQKRIQRTTKAQEEDSSQRHSTRVGSRP